MKYDKQSVLRELTREIAQRESLYPRWVKYRRYGLTPDQAQHQLQAVRKAYDLIESGSSAIRIPFSAVIAELTREITLREKVYPRQVQAGKLHVKTATRRITLLQCAISILCGDTITADGPPQGKLF